jgi:hypothetical protein
MCLKKFDRRKDNINKIKSRVKNIMRAKSYQQRQNAIPSQQSNSGLPIAQLKPLALQGDERR